MGRTILRDCSGLIVNPALAMKLSVMLSLIELTKRINIICPLCLLLG